MLCHGCHCEQEIALEIKGSEIKREYVKFNIKFERMPYFNYECTEGPRGWLRKN